LNSGDVESIIFGLKKKRNIITKTLIPFGTFSSISKNKLTGQNIVIKEMPDSISFEGSFWIIKDIIVHFSGSQPFLVAIKHKAIVDGMKSIYNFLWEISNSKR